MRSLTKIITIKKNKTEFLELKNKMTELKYSIERFKKRLDQLESSNSETSNLKLSNQRDKKNIKNKEKL